ncbi:hypothetical protein GCM10020258_27940 [Sphingomonas yabuuchiae]
MAIGGATVLVLAGLGGGDQMHPASIARARSSTCQCAAPVGRVKAAGTDRIVAPASVSAANSAGKRRS